MTRRITVLAMFCAVVAFATVAQAVPVFHLETSATGPQTPGLLELTNVAPNSMGTLHIWTTSDVRMAGVSLNIAETGGAIKFLGPLDVPNPAAPAPANTRWAFLDGPQDITNSKVSSIGGAAIPGLSGDGIGQGATGAANGANVLVASIPYMALAGGVSQLQLQVGTNGISDYATGGFASVKFGTDTAPDVAGDAFGMGGAVGSIQVGTTQTNPPVITPINLGEVEQSTTIMAQLTASNAPTWSNLVSTTGSPAIAATLSDTGAFSWDPTGSARGPKGSGTVAYSWTATATNADGMDTRVAISLSLIPEPATISLFGLAMVGVLGLVRRRS
jgi:hypothetical protein